MEARLYLDTHIIVWLYNGEVDKLTRKGCKFIDESNLRVSEFVRLELQYLYEIKRLSKEPDTIIRYLEDEIGLTPCDLILRQIITESLRIDWTRDPFDRLIVANASLNNNLLLTKDDKILSNFRKAVF